MVSRVRFAQHITQSDQLFIAARKNEHIEEKFNPFHVEIP